MKTKNIVLLFVLLITIIFITTTCKKDDTTTGCPDKTMLVNKWWYNVVPAAGGISYPSFYYDNNGRLKSKDQDGTDEGYVGTWTIINACDTLNMIDSSTTPKNFTQKIIGVTAHTLKVNNTWTGFGTFPEEYRDTP
jgi:hypothetical protein